MCIDFFLIFKFYLIYFFIQQVLISHQFYTHQCIHVNPNRPIHHTTITTPLRLSPLGVHTFVLYICVSTSSAESFYEPFTQSPPMLASCITNDIKTGKLTLVQSTKLIRPFTSFVRTHMCVCV